MKIVKITPNILKLEYESCEQMNLAFCRISSHSECIEFKGKVFTLGQYRKWYSSTSGTAAWTYADDWNGHNIPSKSLEAFIRGDFDPLTEDEAAIIEAVRYKEPPYYIIAVAKDSRDDALDHEIAHALFGTNPVYQEAVAAKISEYWHKLQPLRDLLNSYGYHFDVLVDECHAYAGVDHDWCKHKGVEIPEDLTKALLKLYDKHKPK